MKRKLQIEQQLYLDYARAALQILQRSLSLARGEAPDFYRVAAVQLRLLLCDTTRLHDRVVDLALVPRLWPEVLWPTLGADGRFSVAQPGLPLAAWLDQPLPDSGLTVRQLIRRVCDQDGGAHVDLRELAGPGDLQQAREWIMAIGDVVTGRLGSR